MNNAAVRTEFVEVQIVQAVLRQAQDKRSIWT